MQINNIYTHIFHKKDKAVTNGFFKKDFELFKKMEKFGFYHPIIAFSFAIFIAPILILLALTLAAVAIIIPICLMFGVSLW